MTSVIASTVPSTNLAIDAAVTSKTSCSSNGSGVRMKTMGHPPPPCDVLTDAIGLQGGFVHAAADQVANDGDLVGTEVDRHRHPRVGHVGRGPVQQVSTIDAPDRLRQQRISRDSTQLVFRRVAS
ncbi:hypothetical protein ACFWPK_09675 [Nocardia sp. NPDC058519]|uniref:hypothetical protein n=1 Tax=Nocardia sp. NPDC058519 TaxID=3346535 RepID=UPI00365B169B